MKMEWYTNEMEKFSLEQASTKAEKMVHKIKTGEATSYADAEKKLNSQESELSPEAIEKIMEKVRDIYAYGTAYTSIPGQDSNKEKDKLKSVLEYGLLGKEWGNDNRQNVDISPEQWGKDVRKRLNPSHFNIVGRTLAYNYHNSKQKPIVETIKDFKETEPGKAGLPFPRMRGFNRVYSPPYITFDISSFKEIDPLFREYNQEGLNRTYRINAPQGEVDMTPDSYNKIGVGAEYGFQLHHRLPPRLITGIVIYYYDQVEVEKMVEVMKTVFSDSGEMVPIYSIEGAWPPEVNSGSINTIEEYNEFLKESATFRLLWPRKMSYEEVHNFINEREKNNN